MRSLSHGNTQRTPRDGESREEAPPPLSRRGAGATGSFGAFAHASGGPTPATRSVGRYGGAFVGVLW
ncbi:hypothetical protein MRX96_043881 [Rhipicephalus microplus]